MKTKAILAAAAISAAATLTGGPLASGAGVAKSEITIKGENGDYFGRVKSPSDYCLANREVTVYKMKGERPRPATDKRIGSSTTEESGKWSIGNSGYRHGKFYARVAKSPVLINVAPTECAGARSEVIKR